MAKLMSTGKRWEWTYSKDNILWEDGLAGCGQSL